MMALGHYFDRVSPSKVYPYLVQDLDERLNALYAEAEEQGCDDALLDSINHTLSYSSALVYYFDKNLRLDRDFFIQVKPLGKALKKLSNDLKWA